MDATISLRTFGRRNNWFSSRLHSFSFSSFRWIVLILGIAAVGLFVMQAAMLRATLQPIEQSLDHLGMAQGFAQQAFSTRLATDSLLRAETIEAYTQVEQSFETLATQITQLRVLAQPQSHYLLARLEQAYSDYRNAFLSLHTLASSEAAPESWDIVREQVVTTGAAFERMVGDALQQSLLSADEAVSALSDTATVSVVASLFILVVIFAVSLALVFAITRHSTYALHQVGAAARQMTLEQYDTRIDVAGEANQDIVDLSMAFNRLAEKLQGALRSESAAQQQNQLQMLKLARQERKTAVLEERQRIAHELHDSVKQQLFSMMLATSAAMNLLDHAPEHVRMYLEHIQQAGHQAQSEMTALVQELVPVSMQDKRLDEALHTYLTPLCDIHGIKLLWRVEGTNALTLAQEHAVFRAVQEAVANVVRHSGATVLRVSLNFSLLTHVIVEDNGSGFEPDAVAPTSTGLSLMQTRLKRAGGHYELQTGPGLGTRLTILIDLRRATLVHA